MDSHDLAKDPAGLTISKAGLGQGWVGAGHLFLPDLENKPRTLTLGLLGRESPLEQWTFCPSLPAPRRH